MAYSFASNWRRFASFMVDGIILSTIITKPLSDLIGEPSVENFTDLFLLDWGNIVLVTFLVSVINFLYWVSLEYKLQQTLGGLIFNISAKSEKGKLTLTQTVLRNITKLSTALLIIDSIGILFSKNKQRFTERLTKTITLENEQD